jgi:hypothetical protein
MTKPVTRTPIDTRRSTTAGLGSRVGSVAYAILRESGWVLWQVCLFFSRAIASLWSRLKQRRLSVQRRELLLQLGCDVRKGVIPDHLRALADECDRLDASVQRYRGAAASGTNWWFRARSRISLLRARAARDDALRKLGESGAASASPEYRTALGDLLARTAVEQQRRSQLWRPWRTLTLGRQAEIIAGVTVLLLAAAILFHSRLTMTRVDVVDNTGRSESAQEDAASQTKKQHDLAGAFARERKAASPGDWLVYAGNPVLARGELNHWDDFKVGNEVVIADASGFRMWYRACHFVLREYTCGIGYAASKDGVSWAKSPEAVFTPQDSHERERLDSLAIVRAGNRYWMWYSVRPDRFKNRPYATIHLAISEDGLSWAPMGPVLRALSQYTGNLEPAAYYDGSRFHMWYTDHPTDENPAVLHLISSDGRKWQTAGSTPLSVLNGNPGRVSVISDGHGGYRAYFASTGQQRDPGVFGVLLSNDGNQWRRGDSESKLSFQDVGSARGSVFAPSVLAAADGRWVWYTFRPYDGSEAIGVAFLREKSS